MGEETTTAKDELCESSDPSGENTSIPVVVMKSTNQTGVGIARSLGRLGIPVYGISPSSSSPAICSRYFKKAFVWDVDSNSKEKTLQCLLAIGKEIGRPSLLIHTTEDSASLLANYAEELSEWFFFPKVSPELVNSLSNKKEMYFLARKHNIPTPEAFFPQSLLDLEDYANSASFPVMLKGIDGQALARRTGKKMFIVKTKDELLNIYTRFEDKDNPNFMIQEYIPGDANSVWMFDGYFNKNSECLFALTGQKIRQYPPYIGATSLGVCLKNDEVVRTTTRFMKLVGYTGIVDIGYRYDARDKSYKVLDINPRIGSTFRLFVGTGGVDVIRAEYLDLTGQRVPRSELIADRKWLVEDWDLISTSKYFRDKKLSLKSWAKSFIGVQEFAWLSWDDPLPFLLTSIKLLKEHLKIV